MGLEPLIPDGGYFMLIDISKLAHDHRFATDPKERKDHKFVKYMIQKHVSIRIFNTVDILTPKLCLLRNWP